MTEKRCSYAYNRVLINSARVLSAQFDDAVIHVSGAQLELLRNVTQYLNRLTTYVSEIHAGYYLTPDAADFDDILEIVADLEETLMGNPNTLFGYSDQINEDKGEIKSGDGSYTAWTSIIPAGKMWLLQHVHFQNAYGTRGTLIVRLYLDSSYYWLIHEPNPGSTLHTWHGQITMKAGDRVNIVQNACIDGDTIWAGIVANEMDVPT